MTNDLATQNLTASIETASYETDIACLDCNEFADMDREKDENELAKRQFESKPFYQIGKYLSLNASRVTQLMNNYYNAAVKSVSERINFILNIPSYLNTGFLSQEEKIKKFQSINLEPYYLSLQQKITVGLKEARDKKKPLMVLIGDNHISLSTGIINSMIFRIAKNHPDFKLKTFFTEMFPTLSRKYEEILPNAFAEMPTSVLMNHAIAKLQLKPIAIDLAACSQIPLEIPDCKNANDYEQLPTLDQESKEAMTIRDRVMAKRMLSENLQDTVAIVGYAHLCGLLLDTKLKDKFHILIINTATASVDLSYTDEDDYRERCPELFNDYSYLMSITEVNDWEPCGLLSLSGEDINQRRDGLTPAMILDKVKKTEERIKQKSSEEYQHLKENTNLKKKVEL